MRFTENEIRKITLTAIEELGEKASPDLVKKVVAKTLNSPVNDFNDIPKSSESSESTGRVLLTAFGINKPGIVAAITGEISKNNCNILDLSQKLMSDFFTMIMLVDIESSPYDFVQIQETMNKTADTMGIKIYLQHEDIFRAMHRI